MKKGFILIAVLFIIGSRPINADTFSPDAFRQETSQHTIATFKFEGVQVTVLDLTYWKKYPIGPFNILNFGIYIDEELYRLYLAGDIKAKFVITHELAHITLRHNVPMAAATQGDSVQANQYNQNEIAADVWAANHLNLSFPEYEAYRKWIDRGYFKDFLNRTGGTTNWQSIFASEAAQIAAVAKLLPPSPRQ
jgi:hypothetical protein